MRGPLKFQLIVARILAILFINVACVDHKNHHFVVVCQSEAQARFGFVAEQATTTATTIIEHEKAQDVRELEAADAGFEFDVNGQERANRGNPAGLIRENHQTIDQQGWPARRRDHLSETTTNPLIDSLHSNTNDVLQDDTQVDSNHDGEDDQSSSQAKNDDHYQDDIHLTNEVNNDNHNYHNKSYHLGMRHYYYGDLALVNSEWCRLRTELDRYCRQLAAQNYSPEALRVCGSDGRFHKSICDFKRQSCSSNNKADHLFSVEPNSYCSTTSGFSRNDAFKCSQVEYRQFKLALLNEFNEDVELMFKYFDSNHNDLIEARELWPRLKDEASTDESMATTRDCDDCYRRPTKDEYAFEPHYEWSPCSLSHLLLYEADRAMSLTRAMFTQAFTRLRNKTPPSETNGTNETPKETIAIETFTTKIVINMGESKLIDCLPEQQRSKLNLVHDDEPDCLWTRYGVNLGAIRDEHIALERADPSEASKSYHHAHGQPLRLHLKDAQLYLSGPYKCSCSFNQDLAHDQRQTIQHQVRIQVLAQPYVSVRPKFLWSLPASRVALECHHDFIDTNYDVPASNGADDSSQPESFETPTRIDGIRPSSDYKLKWFRDGENWIVDSKEYNRGEQQGPPLAECSSRATIMPASGRLVLERVQVNDTGRYHCLVEQIEDPNDQTTTTSTTTTSANDSARIISTSENFAQLLIQDKPESMLDSPLMSTVTDGAIKYLWSFHENGISVYKLRNDDGQELELVRELAGQSLVSSEVEGNWNQLTLCGGLNPDQVVICEWSDNALVVEVPRMTPPFNDDDMRETLATASGPQPPPPPPSSGNSNRVPPPSDKYIYVGQPNLNRVIVMDGQVHELVAIINTEPQPRKLYSFKPNKIHLSKWVRRRLSPMANARWLKAIDEQQQNAKQQQSQAHPLKLTPKSSRLYSDKRQAKENEARFRRHSQTNWPQPPPTERRSMTPPKLVQHDIWLLCYGQPLFVDPTGDLSELAVDLADERATMHEDGGHGPSPSSHGKMRLNENEGGHTSKPPFALLISVWPLVGPHWMPSITSRKLSSSEAPSPSSSSSALSSSPSLASSSTARPYTFGNPTMHHHNKQQIDSHPSSPSIASKAVGKFKRLTVLTTHYVMASRGMSSMMSDQDRSFAGQKMGAGVNVGGAANHELTRIQPQFDLVQSLSVPQVPYSQRENPKFKLHHAYVTHYDERQLYRISMDGYRYDKEINLSDCDPVNLISASQGLLIVQCRSPITHKLVGQLVLDELSSHAIQFNENIKAQESCLTPDNRYLISIHTNQSSTIYVQSVKVDGLNLLYEIKTTLETTQCSFVWRDGYYAAIFVALNRRDRQSELLSLRLADSRLELIVRVPGLMSSTMRHKEPLNVEPELQIVSLSTDSGVHIIDLEENRIIQTMDHRRQRTIPTLLWV